MLERQSSRKGNVIMMRNAGILPAAILVLLTALSCSRHPVEKRQATVVLQDGSQISGTVVASSASNITLAGVDNISRTIPMSQVKSVRTVRRRHNCQRQPRPNRQLRSTHRPGVCPSSCSSQETGAGARGRKPGGT